jgi:hypothetical protein
MVGLLLTTLSKARMLLQMLYNFRLDIIRYNDYSAIHEQRPTPK